MEAKCKHDAAVSESAHFLQGHCGGVQSMMPMMLSVVVYGRWHCCCYCREITVGAPS